MSCQHCLRTYLAEGLYHQITINANESLEVEHNTRYTPICLSCFIYLLARSGWHGHSHAVFHFFFFFLISEIELTDTRDDCAREGKFHHRH